jgi:cob(I)alamin adenosyltransferase
VLCNVWPLGQGMLYLIHNKKHIKMKKELVKILEQAIELANQNIGKAHNFDLEGLSQMLDSYVDDLNEIEEFEVYDDEDEE